MTSRDFCYWLQGYFEIHHQHRGTEPLTADQVDMIKKHLSMVFVHEIDPSYGEHDQNLLNAIHSSQTTVLPPVKPYKPNKIQFGGIDPKTGLVARC